MNIYIHLYYNSRSRSELVALTRKSPNELRRFSTVATNRGAKQRWVMTSSCNRVMNAIKRHHRQIWSQVEISETEKNTPYRKQKQLTFYASIHRVKLKL